jgi:tetratricopeptide (TPR) repeat protein
VTLRHRFLATLAAIAVAAVPSLCIRAADPAAFEQRRATMMKAIETQPEEAVRAFIAEGVAAARPQQALAAARAWLRVNLPAQPSLLHEAGRAAELAGDWEGAVALYQQFLQQADPASTAAGDAILALHTLSINALDNPTLAYAFGRGMATKLAVNRRFRQFDRWFLDTAIARGDRAAVAGRLLATVQASAPAAELLALHEADFRWLVESIRRCRYDLPQDHVTPELVADCQALAAAAPFDEEWRLLLAWSAAVRLYNQAKIAGEEATPPTPEAKALLAKFPRYAQTVQTDWAGGHNGQYYRDDPKKYWPDQIEAKLAPVRAAIPKLSPMQQADLLATWSAGYYVGGPQVLSVEQAREFALANPQLVNHKNGPSLAFGWNSLKPDAAEKLAAVLERNPGTEAALVRAVVAGGADKDFQKAVDALLGPEAWRLGPAELGGRYVDQLWHWAGRPGGNAKRDEQIKRSQAIAAQLQAAPIKPEAAAGDRVNACRRLLADFRSPKPKTPGLLGRLAQAVSVTPEIVPELLRDTSVEARRLLRAAVASDFTGPKLPLSGDPNVRGLSPTRYDPLLSRLLARHGRNLRYLEQNNLYRAHPLEPVLRQAVVAEAAKNAIDPTHLIAWINARGPADPQPAAEADAERKLVAAIVTSPAWATLPAEARFAVRAAFPRESLPPDQWAVVEAADPSLICRALRELPKEADAAATAAAIKAAVAGLQNSPVRREIVGLEQLGEIAPEVFADPQVIAAVATVADPLRSFTVPAAVGERLLQALTAGRDEAVLEQTAAYLWRHVQLHHRPLPQVIDLAESLVDDAPSAASSLAACGLGTIARHKHGHTWFNAAKDVPRLQAIRGRAAMQLGLVVIPVPPDHPAYPVYQSQAEWLTGNIDTAGKLLDAHHEAFIATHRQLTAPYLLWALRRAINSRDDARLEAVARPLLSWAAEPTSPFTPEEKLRLELAYGEIAVQRGQLREAFQIFGRTHGNPAFKDLPSRHEAALRQAGVARAMKDFETALAILAELDLERIPELWSPIRRGRAEVFFDMEEYDDAADTIDAILARDPDDAEARILLGKVQVKREQLIEATEVEFGSATGQKTLVPGEKLKVTLNDPTLAVSGAGTEIEVSVWTSGGDREQFLLRRFGDQKDKFRGEVATALGLPAEGDGTLQVTGDDQIFYAYSDAFRAKMPGLPDTRGGPIIVASDALLMASARKLPTAAEQRLADMREVMDRLGVSEARAGRMLGSEKAVEVIDQARRSAETAARVVKPGNPIHIRVIDPDRSRTSDIDELVVSVAAASGDGVSRVVLKETGPVTGRFESSLRTTAAQASAFASSSEPGRNPNMVLSPATGYPAWKPVPGGDATPEFTIDLNDNVPLGELTITAAEPAARLTKFAMQTAINAGNWTTVAVVPNNMLAIPDPWRPSVVVLNDTDHHQVNRRESLPPLAELAAQADRGWITQQYPQGVADNVLGPSAAFPASIPEAIAWKRHGRHNTSGVIHRFRGWFYEPADVTRRFRLDLGPHQIPPNTHPSVSHPATSILAVDGVPITKPGEPLTGEITLKPGLHRLEIWSIGWVTSIGFGRTAALFANLDPEKPTSLVPCPDAFFDPQSFPPDVTDHRNAPAEVTASPDGTEFRVRFAEGSRARFIRLDLLGHEGPAPAIGKITLTAADGKRVLPVAEDFATLNKNDSLEILPGDTVAVRYIDDRFVTEAKEIQERSLKVAFTDARVEFADMQPRIDPRIGELRPFYERLLRFRHGEPLMLAIHDADMDVSVEPDTVRLTLDAGTDAGREYTALETGDSTGVFKLVITPVAPTAEPDTAADGDEQFAVAVGGTIRATYRDQENNFPSIPIDRVATIPHAAFTEPRLLLAHASASPVEPPRAAEAAPEQPPSVDRPRWQVENTLLSSETPPEGGFAAVAGQPLFAELVAADLVLRPSSTVTVYAQTDSGRRLAGIAPADQGPPSFDITVPGTIAVECALTPARLALDRLELSPIYTGGRLWNSMQTAATDRFFVTIPLVAGILPDHGVLTPEEREQRRREAAAVLGSTPFASSSGGLIVRPGDRVHLGFQFTDADGTQRWLTASTRVVTHPAFDLVADDGEAAVTSAYVGEVLLARVTDFGADTTDSADAVGVIVQSKSGGKQQLVLHETAPHSGVFTGTCRLAYATAPGEAAPTTDGDAAGLAAATLQQLPVIYGDTVAARYTDAQGVSTETLFVTIRKGADGTISPFSKVYGDSAIAAQTQFSLAEAYLEMAKRHRSLGQTDAANREYAAAKQMLAGVMNQFTDTQTRAHAEYLLGSLTMDEAGVATDPAARDTLLRSALARFMNVTGTYPDTIHAAKAQFKIATVYEALGEPEIAAQDYVKLAYKYPESEHLAIAMARLGTFFLRRATAYEKKAQPLLAKAESEDNADARFQGEQIREQAVSEYLKTARIFGRLQERFPSHALAGAAGLRAGQAYLRVGERRRALEAFLRVAREPAYDGPKVRAEAMYWSGVCYQQLNQPLAAFSTYKRLTYDFPESEWAKNAIGQLSQPAFLKMESNRELERLEAQQQ